MKLHFSGELPSRWASSQELPAQHHGAPSERTRTRRGWGEAKGVAGADRAGGGKKGSPGRLGLEWECLWPL